MQQEKIELRQKFDVGEMIKIYFDFFKQNFKNFTNIFISYNGVFILTFLGISYLLVTGFIGVSKNSGDDSATMLIGFGALAFFLVFIVVAALNYSLSSSYISHYVKQDGIDVEKKSVWKLVLYNFGNIIVFILLLIVIYIGFFVASMILAFIPIIGGIAQWILSLAMTSWFGVSFMVMLHEKKGVTEAFGEGWRLVTKNFWKCVGVNLIIGVLTGILIILVLTIPGVLIGIYSFHAVETGVDIKNSVVAKTVWIIGLCVFFVIITYSQVLSQFINGILYFSIHEQTYNEYTREKIKQIGSEN